MMKNDILLSAYENMCTAREMAAIYEANRSVCRYVHSTSSGHEAIQLAIAYNLLPIDFVSPYYRDESLLLGLGFSPYSLMLQLLAKRDDPFTGGRAYYSHPNYRGPEYPTIIQQSSATGMQVIPATGLAQGLQYLEKIGSPLLKINHDAALPVVICSLGDASVTEGEVSEAFQVAALKKLPIVFVVQDNEWGISVSAEEARVMNAYDYIAGFPGIERIQVNGSDFEAGMQVMTEVVERVRKHRSPVLVHAKVPLLGHHTSGVRKEFYRTEDDLSKHRRQDPLGMLKNTLLNRGVEAHELLMVEQRAKVAVAEAFAAAVSAQEPATENIDWHVFAPPAVTKESGSRVPINAESVFMVDAALHALREILEAFPEAILFGQDVGLRLGGVFRETATLAQQFGDHRVFNTAIQEAYIVGSTAGLSATGVKPIVEIQFADYFYPALNQLVCEIAKSCFLSCGRFPVQTLIRVPVGAYGGGGPYHSASIESTLLSIKGIKICYPSNAADMKGLMKAAFLDPNPVIILEHKGLYWGKVPGTEAAKTIEPATDYLLPMGIANIVTSATQAYVDNGTSCCIVTYGMGVHWALAAAATFGGALEVIDLRTLFPLDEDLLFARVKLHGRCLVLTEEQQTNSFAEALAHRITTACFKFLDAPVAVLGALDLPAVPLNIALEQAMLPTVEKLKNRINALLQY